MVGEGWRGGGEGGGSSSEGWGRQHVGRHGQHDNLPGGG
jgi:hypothetical protein